MTRDLLELADWLQRHHVTHVAMESTGVYWKPVWNILEGQFAVVLVNAQHIKAVPGRKTDIKECQWIAELLQHGLLRGSFVPPTPIRELRDLTRLRASLRQDHTAIANRRQKILEDANIKLAQWRVIGSASRAVPFLLSSWPAKRTPGNSLSYRGGACGPSFLPCSWHWRAA